jgi:hypothetical protein
MWANAYKAYDELSPAMKDFCEGLSALHDAHPHGNPEQMAIHPVVRVHPVTKKKSLFVNEHFTRRIVELSHQESEALLAFLVRWIQSPRFTVRYHWTPGTIAMWDNRCTQHHVLNDFEGERVIQRVTVMGDRPEPARAAALGALHQVLQRREPPRPPAQEVPRQPVELGGTHRSSKLPPRPRPAAKRDAPASVSPARIASRPRSHSPCSARSSGRSHCSYAERRSARMQI